MHVTISSKRIDLESGCCRGNLDTLAIARIKDVGLHATCMQRCFGRGTITIISADETNPELKLTFRGARQTFELLKGWCGGPGVDGFVKRFALHCSLFPTACCASFPPPSPLLFLSNTRTDLWNKAKVKTTLS